MAAVEPRLAEWHRMLERPEDDWSIEEAAMRLARAEYPSLDVSEQLARFDALADLSYDRGVRDAAGLMELLFGSGEFRGNRDDYEDPRNSYLNEVLDRKLGLPITLSVVAIAIGRRLGIPLGGVGMPAHFLVGSRGLYYDPFDSGTLRTAQECRTWFESLHHGKLPWSDRFLDPSPPRAIVTRMLNNLKAGYVRSGDYYRARRTVHWLLVVNPESRDDRRLLTELNEWHARMN